MSKSGKELFICKACDKKKTSHAVAKFLAQIVNFGRDQHLLLTCKTCKKAYPVHIEKTKIEHTESLTSTGLIWCCCNRIFKVYKTHRFMILICPECNIKKKYRRVGLCQQEI